jgi:hypothetical protein
MSVAEDLGVLGSLATALGLLDEAGSPRGEWLTEPGTFLSGVLSEDGQRAALVEFLDTVLGGSQVQVEGDLTWLPIVELPDPQLTVYAVLDERGDSVVIGVGVRLRTIEPASQTSAHVPVFQVARGTGTVTSPIALGTPAGTIALSTEVTIDPDPAAAGATALRAVRLRLAVPSDGGIPTIGITLAGLQLPGAAQPRDVTLDTANLDQLDDAVRELLLGLLAERAGAAGGSAEALAGLLGLGGDAVPALPLEQLISAGPTALATWFESVVSAPPARDAWLGHLAVLLGGSLSGGEVVATFGTVQLRLGLQSAPGTDGHPLVTVGASLAADASGVTARAQADLLQVSLGGAGVLALPRLEVAAIAGRRQAADPPLLAAGAAGVQIDAMRIGVALDGQRRPVLVLAADGVTIAGRPYGTVDLSSPEAVAEAGATILSQVVDDLLDRLGPVGDVVRLVLGVTPPPGFPGAPTLDLAEFLRDPVGAVAARWRALLAGDPLAVRAVLEPLRDAVADAGVAGDAVTGTGTEADPWRVPLAGPVGLLAWRPGADRVALALAASYLVDDLGHGCTRVATSARLLLLEVDLAARSGAFLGGAELALAISACDGGPLRLDADALVLTTDRVELTAGWRPADGFTVRLGIPGTALVTDQGVFPLPLPEMAADGTVTFDDWDALEAPLAALAAIAPVWWLDDLAALAGWGPSPVATGPHLRLADLVADPDAALRRWLLELALSANPEVLARAAGLVGRLLGARDGAGFGLVTGSGTPGDPYLVQLAVGASVPALAIWWTPDGPAQRVITEVPGAVHGWRPGDPGVPSATLADALDREASRAEDVADLLRGRPPVEAGLEALATRWVGTDGLVAPPTSAPAGVTVHPLPGAHHGTLADQVDLGEVLGAPPPATVVHVAVVAPGAWLPGGWPDGLPADRVVDLRAPGLAPEAFGAPAAAPGDWFVLLGGRAACRLAAGDSDGVLGQSARLGRAVAALAAGGPVALVGYGAAGHPAIRIAQQQTAIAALVTVGTPLSPLTFAVLDADPAGDTLRLLSWLLPAPAAPEAPATGGGDGGDGEEPPLEAGLEPDDGDLTAGRTLVGELMALTRLGEPAGELGLPATTDAASGGLPPGFPRAGLAVHALYGTLTEDDVGRALTAIVAAGLAERARGRAARPAADPDGLHAGLLLPLGVPGTGTQLTVDGHLLVELATLTDGGAGTLQLAAAPRASVRLDVGRSTGWLVGGPDPGRAPGTIRETELRRVSLRADLPLTGSGGDRAAVILHEVRAFEFERERWTVAPAGALDPLADAVTVVLPEVRVVLSRLAERLAGAGAGPAGAPLQALLRAAGLLDAAGGFIADGIDDLLHDPLGHVGAILASPAQASALVAAVRALVPGAAGAAGDPFTVGPLTVTPDLTVGTVALRLLAPEGFGAVHWSASLTVARGGVTGHARLGAAPGGSFTAAGRLHLELGGPPPAAALVWERPGGEERLPLDDIDPAQLARLLGRTVPAEVVRLALEALRELDLQVKPVLDAVLDALGLLGPDAAGVRRVLLPVALLADPGAWLRHETALGGGPSGLRPDRVAGLLDALRPLLGVAGSPGVWQLATGVSFAAAADGDRVRLGVSVDSGAFAPPGGVAGRLALGGSAALRLAANAPPDIAVGAFVGRAGALPGREAVHLEVGTGQPVSLLLRPATGADIVLLPGGPGLGALAGAGAARALPLVLDAIAEEDGADLAGDVGRAVAALGDALGLRSGTPPRFDADRLAAWADPAAAFAAAWPTLAPTALTTLADAVGPLVQRAVPAASVQVLDGALRLQVSRLSATLDPSPFSVGLLLDVPALLDVGRVQLGVDLDGGGLRALDAEVGPADLDLGGVHLHPFVGVHAGGAPAGGRRVEAGLGLGGDRALVVRLLLGGAVTKLVRDGAAEDLSGEAFALAMVEAVLDLVGAVVLAADAVDRLLDKAVGAHDVDFALRGVLLKDGAAGRELDDALTDLDRVLGRLLRLARNLAQCAPTVAVGGLRIGVSETAGVAGVTLGIDGRFDVVPAGDVTVSLETDATWIDPAVPAGVTLGLVDVSGAEPVIAPALVVGGVGIRLAGGAGPLIDTGIRLDSIALHTFAQVDGDQVSGGAQLQLAGLGLAVGGAAGGNPVAQGILAETGAGGGSGGQRLAPTFSPALAVQKHDGQPVKVSLRAGPGDGPWWVSIQRGFGPVYVEQVGLGITVRQDQLERIGLLLDGRVSIFGLTAAVDDLQVSCFLAATGAPWDPGTWSVDLAGLAVNADMGGLLLQGGLRKFGEGANVEYIGMLLARFAVYGLSIYGGYGRTSDASGPFSSFFAFGAVVGPIGGPPAFFVTGIGGGLGINRRLIVPTDLSQFGQYPLVKALDPGARPSADPMQELANLRAYFPAARGMFWFAAGLSFNSFALVDGVAVVAIQIGDGFEIAILGLARMALPRPQAALVSIELALIARFSTREGVLWIQAQLTDNSWLLYPEVRLTGGFAYVLWFAGIRRGEFVVTLGGYHPDFHRDGYPLVPRLGLTWRFGPVAVKGESYFALTSEAIMAGVRVQASAEFGPAWAHMEFGADGIIYYDPFHFKVTVYGSISAGVTIDLFFGEITISIHIGARVTVEGPSFHGTATFEVGPIELTVEFGDIVQELVRYLAWGDFVVKYLEATRPGVARALSAIPGRGAVPPSTPQGASQPAGTADGSPERPFEVLVEFDITVTSTVPLTRTEVGTLQRRTHPNGGLLGIAPMGKGSVEVVLKVELLDGVGNPATQPGTANRVDDALVLTHRDTGTYPRGVWGKPKSIDSPTVPAGDVVPGTEGVILTAVARPGTRLGPYRYDRVEVRRRQPLPLVSEAARRPAFLTGAQDVAGVIGDLGAETEPAVLLATATEWLRRGARSRTSLAAYAGERITPPRLGTLTDRLARAELPATDLGFPDRRITPPVDGRVHAPIAIAVLSDPSPKADLAAPRTTLEAVPVGVPRTPPPSLALVGTQVDTAVPARLVIVAPSSAASGATLIAAGAAPPTGPGRSGSEALLVPGAALDGVTRLAALTAAIERTPKRPREQLRVGEVAVLRLPNADADLDPERRPTLLLAGADARLVALGPGGAVLADVTVPAGGSEVPVPHGAERLAVAAVGTAAANAPAPGLAGWHSGQSLPYIGWSAVLGGGVVVRSEGQVARRGIGPVPTGWVQVAELVAGATLVETRFTEPIEVVVVAIDDPAGALGGDGRGLTLGLAGAHRRRDADGQPTPPTSLVTGGRTFLVHKIEPEAGAAVAVTVASGADWRLAGVLGARGPAGDVAGRLARQGLDTAVAPLIAGTDGSLRVGWLGVPDGEPAAKRRVRRRTTRTEGPPSGSRRATRGRR